MTITALTWKNEKQKAAIQLSTLTRAEKLELISARGNFRTGDVSRAGIPSLVFTDGPHGIRREYEDSAWLPKNTDDDKSCYLPVGIALAATWNPELGIQYGEVLGEEARSRGKDVLLGPGVNIARTPLCGRTFEYLGEDPYLTSQMAKSYVQGVQSRGTAACVKHFALNNQELDRNGSNVDLEESVLQEIYLPAFKACVDANVLTLMGAYNKVRGQWCCHNEFLLDTVLRKAWDFSGFVVSDWAGTHDTKEAILHGIDIEMGGERQKLHLYRPFEKLLESGSVSEEYLDKKVLRILTVQNMLKVLREGLAPAVRLSLNHKKVAENVAAESIVLLKNSNNVLPLNLEKIKKIAVIGSNAKKRHSYGGGSSAVKPPYEITPWEGLQTYVNNKVEFYYTQGYPSKENQWAPIPVEYLSIADSLAGLNGWTTKYFNQSMWNGECVKTQAETYPEISKTEDHSINREILKGLTATRYSCEWQTEFQAPESGNYRFLLQGTDWSAFLIDGDQKMGLFGSDEMLTKECVAELKKGITYRFTVRFSPLYPDPELHFTWIPPWVESNGEEEINKALKLAQSCDAVLYFGGLDHSQDAESQDRTELELPDGQDQLIEALLNVNPNTVFCFSGGSAFLMPWEKKASTILLTWYAGMEGGTAISQILFGKSSPSGKLPLTFPMQLSDSPAHAEGEYQSGNTYYREGHLVGYRYFERKNKLPLFAFGHGLSYGQCVIENNSIKWVQSKDALKVSGQLKNIKTNDTAETLQLYTGPGDSKHPFALKRPLKELKAFQKLWLKPGQSLAFEISVALSTLHIWENGAWVPPPYRLQAALGFSTVDIKANYTLDAF